MSPEEILRKLWEGGFFYIDTQFGDVNWGYREGSSIKDLGLTSA